MMVMIMTTMTIMRRSQLHDSIKIKMTTSTIVAADFFAFSFLTVIHPIHKHHSSCLLSSHHRSSTATSRPALSKTRKSANGCDSNFYSQRSFYFQPKTHNEDILRANHSKSSSIFCFLIPQTYTQCLMTR